MAAGADRFGGADGDREGVVVFARMGRLVQAMERELGGRLAAVGLTPGLFDLVLRVAEEEGLTQRELAARLFHSPPNVSVLVAKLEAAGLVERRPAGRAFRLFLTPKGRALHDAVAPAHAALMAARLAALAPAERAELRRLLRKLERGPPRPPHFFGSKINA